MGHITEKISPCPLFAKEGGLASILQEYRREEVSG